MKDDAMALDNTKIHSGMGLSEHANWHPHWRIEKYHGNVCPENLYEVEEFDGNLLLNEGITELLTLLIGGTATAFNNANARIGVGDSSTAAAATQTDLQAAVNKTYKAMDTDYPQVSNQTVTFRATFGPSDANYNWNEFVVDNGSSAGKTLNRKVESHGTKVTDSWVVQLSITMS